MIEPVIIGDAELWLGDCLDILPTLGKVDAVITDPPYGITQCEWDIMPNLKKLWDGLKLIGKDNCAYVFTASQPFTTDLINSNRAWFKYEWIWEKNKAVGFLDCRIKPMKLHENIIIFYQETPCYNPQFYFGEPYIRGYVDRTPTSKGVYGNTKPSFVSSEDGSRFPKSIIKDIGVEQRTEHPSQKPIALMEYLIRTYSNESDTILDPFMGSGTTGVAALKLGRKFIGIEISEQYFDIACNRIETEYNQLKLFDTVKL